MKGISEEKASLGKEALMIRWELYSPDGNTVFRNDYDDTLYSVLIPVETNRCRYHDDDMMCSVCCIELTQWVDDKFKELAKAFMTRHMRSDADLLKTIQPPVVSQPQQVIDMLEKLNAGPSSTEAITKP